MCHHFWIVQNHETCTIGENKERTTGHPIEINAFYVHNESFRLRFRYISNEWVNERANEWKHKKQQQQQTKLNYTNPYRQCTMTTHKYTKNSWLCLTERTVEHTLTQTNTRTHTCNHTHNGRSRLSTVLLSLSMRYTHTTKEIRVCLRCCACIHTLLIHTQVCTKIETHTRTISQRHTYTHTNRIQTMYFMLSMILLLSLSYYGTVVYSI